MIQKSTLNQKIMIKEFISFLQDDGIAEEDVVTEVAGGGGGGEVQKDHFDSILLSSAT